MPEIKVIGAGLAGSEAAWQLANRGIKVELYEMKPIQMTEAHKSQNFGELVCSNSLRSDRITNGVGLLKEELVRIGSLIMEAAYAIKQATISINNKYLLRVCCKKLFIFHYPYFTLLNSL